MYKCQIAGVGREEDVEILLTRHLVQEGNGAQGWGLSQQDPGKGKKDWERRSRMFYKACLRLHQFFK